MATPLEPERYQRIKDEIEACLRDGFAPYRSPGGKGSSLREAARRLHEKGYPETAKRVTDIVRNQEKWKAQGKDHWLPDWSLYAPAGLAPEQIKAGKVHRWILTSAQDDTDVHQRLWTNLKAYANYLGAELHVGGFTYQQRRHTDRETLTNTYRSDLREYMRFDQLECGPVLFAAEMNTLPTAVRPLSGLLTYGRGRDTVFPHAKLAYQTAPVPSGGHVPSVLTTGAVTVDNYIEKKAGLKARFHHVLGATMVEVNGDGEAFIRPIVAASDGSFQDLDVKVRNGSVSRGHRVKAVTWGDIHCPSVEVEVFDALWGQYTGSMIDTLQPEYQFFHDLISFENWSRHVVNDPIHRAKMWYRGMTGMQGHMVAGAEFLRKTQRQFCRSVDIESNHNDRLRQWATANPDRNDTENYIYWLDCNKAMVEAARDGDDEFNLYHWALKNADSRQMSGVEFIPIGGSFQILQEMGGIECGLHGHEGPNGARGGAVALSKLATKITVGDAHSPAIHDGVYVTGMTGCMDQGYNTGPSSWKRAHVITYSNGKRTIVTQAESGAWRA
ncbi:MAG: hypothetical protein EP341_09590 [Sphingomonadales bacterium]|nr:MAG: hypothetical protein EP341_09590 [Sphingomonadales bacterium]